MARMLFNVTGKDQSSGVASEMSISAPSVPDAADFARQRGLVVEAVTTPQGVVYLATESGGFARGDTSSSSDGSAENGLLFVCFVVPVVGIIVGAVRLAKRDDSGGRLLVAGLAGAMVFGVILAGVLTG